MITVNDVISCLVDDTEHVINVYVDQSLNTGLRAHEVIEKYDGLFVYGISTDTYELSKGNYSSALDLILEGW